MMTKNDAIKIQRQRYYEAKRALRAERIEFRLAQIELDNARTNVAELDSARTNVVNALGVAYLNGNIDAKLDPDMILKDSNNKLRKAEIRHLTALTHRDLCKEQVAEARAKVKVEHELLFVLYGSRKAYQWATRRLVIDLLAEYDVKWYIDADDNIQIEEQGVHVNKIMYEIWDKVNERKFKVRTDSVRYPGRFIFTDDNNLINRGN